MIKYGPWCSSSLELTFRLHSHSLAIGLGLVIVTFDLSDSECRGKGMSTTARTVVQLRIGGDDRCHESHGNDHYQHRDGFDSIRCHLFSFCLFGGDG